MKKPDDVVTRRDFIRTTTQASFAVAVGLPLAYQKKEKLSGQTTVVLVRHQDAVDSSRKINSRIVERMFDDAVSALTGCEDRIEAWKTFIKPEDIVGIKSNVWGPLPTPELLENTIVDRLQSIGVEKKNISVDDRGADTNKIFKRSTALINIRPMRTHHWAGVGGCIKNYIIFDADRPKYHPDSCASLGKLWQLPGLRKKTRLNILVLLTPLFHGIGPHHWDVKYTWPYKGIVVGTDPVAVDTVGLKIIEAHRLRHFGEIKPLWPPAKHIALADTQYHVGIGNLKNINIKKIGWKEGLLIDEG